MDQKRLTHKAKYTVKYKKNQDVAYHECIDKLGELEDLAEQGKLLKLPCAVGDTVYQIVKNNAFIRKLKVVYFVAFSNDEIYMKCEECNGNNYGEIIIDEIGKTVFLNEEEAKTALQEKKRTKDD